MNDTGYMNPMRNMERRLSPDFAQREMRDPGLRSSGLGSLHHTMPHLRRINAGAMRLAGGGSPEALAQTLAAARPYRYDPDLQRRQMLQSLRISTTNPDMRALPGSTESWPYADGGGVDDASAPPPEDLMQPEDQQSPDEGDERQVVLEAMAALEGQSDDPEEALAHFIDTFGPQALKDLQQMVESKHRQQQQEDEGDEDDEEEGAEQMPLQQGDEGEGGDPEDELQGAGGGLLNGPGTGQSDEIEGSTPSGRPVLLSDGEYVFDAPTVAALGDG